MQQFPKRYALYTLALLAVGCSAGLTNQVRCRLDALRGVPEDPGQITVYDAVDLAGRLQACRAAPDGGAQ